MIVPPYLSATQPNASLPRAGLTPLLNVTHTTVFAPSVPNCNTSTRSISCLGTYNHATQVTTTNNTLLVAWHNGAYNEDASGGRVLYSCSNIKTHEWSAPRELFESTGVTEAMNGSWTYSTGFHRFDRRQYAFAGAYNIQCSPTCQQSSAVGCHQCLGCCSCATKIKLPQLVRRIFIDENEATNITLGPVAWLATAKTMQKDYNHLLNPIEKKYVAMDRIKDPYFYDDCVRYNQQKVNARAPPTTEKTVLSERSMYLLHDHRPTDTPTDTPNQTVNATFALLLRDDASPSSLVLWSSFCQITLENRTILNDLARATSKGNQIVLPSSKDLNCKWSVPLRTNIPDSRSSTCAGEITTLSNNLTYLFGSQLNRQWDRDPLTLALSTNGIDFEVLNSVNDDAPPVVFPGTGKGPGYAYPQAVVVGDHLMVAYSANKEDIVITQIPFSSLGVTGTSSSKVKRGVTNDQDFLLDSL